MQTDKLSIRIKGFILGILTLIIMAFSAVSLFTSIDGVKSTWGSYHTEAVFRLTQLGLVLPIILS